MRSVMALGAVALILAGAYGCAQSAEEDVDEGSGAVESNTEDKTHTFAVGLELKGGAVCSGVLIAPNLVMTAQHCVSASTGERFLNCATDKFTGLVPATDVTVTTDAKLPARNKYEVSEIFVPTDEQVCASDLALVVLKKNVPASEANPATPLVKDMNRAELDSKIAAIGYGASSAKKGKASEGTRRIKEKIAYECIPGSDKPCDNDKHGVTGPREFATKGGVCLGDSGSGAFDQESLKSNKGANAVVVGVLSRVGKGGPSCSDAVYIRTDMHAPLIMATGIEAAQRGGYAVPAWANPQGADGGTSSDGGGVSYDYGDDDDDYDYVPDGGAPRPPPEQRTQSTSKWRKLLDFLAGIGSRMSGGDNGYGRLPFPFPGYYYDAGTYDASSMFPTTPVPSTYPQVPPGGDRYTDSSYDSSSSSDDNDDSTTPTVAPKKKAADSGCNSTPNVPGTSGALVALGLATGVGALVRRRRRR